MFKTLTIASAVAAGLAAAAAPADAHLISNHIIANGLNINALGYNALIGNAINLNALTPVGSAIDQLNGVSVERVTLPQGADETVGFNPQPDPPGRG